MGFNIGSEVFDVGAEVVRRQGGSEDAINEGAFTIAAGTSRSQDEGDSLLAASVSHGFLAHFILAQIFQVGSETGEVPVDDLSNAIGITTDSGNLVHDSPIDVQLEFDSNGLVDAIKVLSAGSLSILDVLACGDAQTASSRASLGKIHTAIAHIRAEGGLSGTHHQGSVSVSRAVVSSHRFVIDLERDALGSTESLNKGFLLDGVIAEVHDVLGKSFEIPVPSDESRRWFDPQKVNIVIGVQNIFDESILDADICKQHQQHHQKINKWV